VIVALRAALALSFESMKSTTSFRPATPPPPALLLRYFAAPSTPSTHRRRASDLVHPCESWLRDPCPSAIASGPLAALDYFTLAIGKYHDAGNTYMICLPLGTLAAFFDRFGRYEPAATIAGFAATSPLAALPALAEFGTAIAHLRDVLGETTYESLARKGDAMTIAEIVTYAYDQMDQARAELKVG
jgi:hypothetical protein